MIENKIILLFPDGVAIRNYLYSDVFKDTTAELHLWHWMDEATEKSLRELAGIVTHKMASYKESWKEKFLRELICISRLKHNAKKVQNDTILSNWNSNHKGFSKKIFYFLIEIASKIINNYSEILKLEERYQKELRQNCLYAQSQAVLRKEKPAKIFCGHQRGIQCAAIFAAAKDLGIPTYTVIYSWDNLPKARMALRADRYLVWSEFMKQEMHLYYPEIKNEQVLVTGTPQFEFYSNPQNIMQRDEFFKRYNLDYDKKIICYSGDDEKTSPDDPQYLRDLAEELLASGLSEEYQVLLRRCPVDTSNRYRQVLSEFPDLIKVADPIWNFKNATSWTTVYPLPEDIILLVSTAYYCDLVVNLGSTMVFDFSMFDKPCIYINYDQILKSDPHWSVKTIYAYQHFSSMPNLQAVNWWNEKQQFSELLRKTVFTSHTLDWRDIVLGKHYEKASNNIKKILQ